MQVSQFNSSLSQLRPTDARNEIQTSSIAINCLIAGLTLGTAWAVRGKFGHEQGAAWAGAIGALSILLLAKRSYWYPKVFKASLAAAFGWGLGGMISYGRVVGFGRATDFINVFYGLLMLFVIGGLYGFLGGGLFGLALAETDKYKVKWHSLIVEMTVWALITYAFVINQLEWLMTPPRSELWAACLGMAIALGWYLLRNKQESPLRVAVFTCLGSGFGFAFGNFLQVLGSISGIEFNFWNVMEYSIGFFGGLGMAYGTFTSQWPVSETTHKKSNNLIPILILVLFIPFVVWEQSFDKERLQEILNTIAGSNPSLSAIFIQLIAFISIAAIALNIFNKYYLQIKSDFVTYDYKSVKKIFIWYLGLYIFLSFLITGTPFFTHYLEQYLYLVNLGVIFFTLPRLQSSFTVNKIRTKQLIYTAVLLIICIALLSFVAIHSHSEIEGSQKRFEWK